MNENTHFSRKLRCVCVANCDIKYIFLLFAGKKGALEMCNEWVNVLCVGLFIPFGRHVLLFIDVTQPMYRTENG